MPRKYEVIDELIRDEIKDFLYWLEMEKNIELCKSNTGINIMGEALFEYFPIHKAPEDLINEYMEIYNDC